MIKSIVLDDYKGLRNFRAEGLERLTVLVGPNGVGKTRVLDGIRYALRQDGPLERASVEVECSEPTTVTASLKYDLLDLRCKWYETVRDNAEGARSVREVVTAVVGNDSIFRDDAIPYSIGAGAAEVLAVALALYGEERSGPRVVLIDDMGKNLYPKAQALLVAQLRRALDAQPGLQVVAATHCPYLLDALSFDEVRVLSAEEGGTVACRSLSALANADRWRGYCSAGEFWATVM